MNASPPAALPSSPFILPPRPLSPVESLAHSSSFMSLDLEEDITAILEHNKADIEQERATSILSPLWDALSHLSPSSHASSVTSSPIAWMRKSKTDKTSKQTSKRSRSRSGRTPKKNGAGPLPSSPLRESHSPEWHRLSHHQHTHASHIEEKQDPDPPYLEREKPPLPPRRSPFRPVGTQVTRNKELTDNFDRHNRARPFRPNQRSSGRGTPSWQLRQFAEATLGSGSLRKAVKLPEGEDENEWLAVNVVDFYNQINLLYGSITEFCSPTSCPVMKATEEYEYLWQDSSNPQYKRPTKMSAPDYIEHLMTWCQTNIDNTELFPAKLGVNFPKQFKPTVQNMFKRLYRVYAHIYCHHYPVIMQLGLEAHLNTSFKHFCLFIEEFKLAEGPKGKDEFYGPLNELVEGMLKVD